MAAADPTLLPLLTRALSSEAAPGEQEAMDERILDATLDLVAAYGARRTSMDDIAQRAGVGRATVFRRFRSKEAVIERLFVRELQRFLASVNQTILAAPDPTASVVDTFVAVVRFAAAHPLVDRLSRVEPQVLIQALRTGDPSPLELGRSFVADHIRAGQRKGTVPARDADELADILVRLALTYILIPSEVVDLEDEERTRAFAQSAIAPILTDRGSRSS